jgi:hypothetical protein
VSKWHTACDKIAVLVPGVLLCEVSKRNSDFGRVSACVAQTIPERERERERERGSRNSPSPTHRPLKHTNLPLTLNAVAKLEILHLPVPRSLLLLSRDSSMALRLESRHPPSSPSLPPSPHSGPQPSHDASSGFDCAACCECVVY